MRAVVPAMIAASLVVLACNKVPYTGRKQFNPIPGALMSSMGKQSYADTLQGATVAAKGEDTQTLQRVGRRISKVANEPRFDWQYTLIEEATVNAWCMPGGYIAFYTGILPVLENEAGMAFVMGHEVGHAIAKHGAERVGQQIGVMGGLTALQAWANGKSKLSAEQKAMLFGALGMGAEIGVLLPFSRMHESEADVIGMMYMADAGYPPAEAPEVWVRMGALGGSKPPTFLSTHPSNEQRQANLKKWLPQARKKYARNKLPGDVTTPLW